MEFQKISDKELHEKLEEFQKLIESRKEMPNIDKVLLLRNLKFFNGSVERAMKRLRSNLELRNYYPNIYFRRDPQDAQLRRLIDQIEMIPLPKVTPQNNRIILIRLIDFNPDHIIFDDAITVFSMVYDISLITPEKDGLADGEIAIFDFKGMTVKHLTKLSFSTLRCYFKYMLEAHPMRVKEVHVLNCSSVLDKLMMIIKPFLGAKIMKTVHFHAPDSTTLFDYIPQDVLPTELGGVDGSTEESKWEWIKRVENRGDFFLNNEQWKIADPKSSSSNNNNDISIEDSFTYMGFC